LNGPAEPFWLELCELEAIHTEVMLHSGGLPGTRDRGLIESALLAVRNSWNYTTPPPTLTELAARLGYGLVKNHGFVDGNKRTAFIAVYTFLAINGIALKAGQASVVEAMQALAASTEPADMTQKVFHAWIISVVRR
jgi:death-on-curing protein